MLRFEIAPSQAFTSMARSVTQTKPDRPKNVKRDPLASGERDASVNRGASHKYSLLEKFEAGLLLRGTEVTAIRSGQVQLRDAYGLVNDGEGRLQNAQLGPSEHGNSV